MDTNQQPTAKPTKHFIPDTLLVPKRGKDIVKQSPTAEQIKEFWEWCGWKPCRIHAPMSPKKDGWENPLPVTSFDQYSDHLPVIDLNNLFKYAVPMIRQKELWFELQRTSIENLIWEVNIDPALALFWAIYEIIGK